MKTSGNIQMRCLWIVVLAYIVFHVFWGMARFSKSILVRVYHQTDDGFFCLFPVFWTLCCLQVSCLFLLQKEIYTDTVPNSMDRGSQYHRLKTNV